MSDAVKRCPWCGTDPLYVAYHDTEWGVPVRDDVRLFEMLTLEGAQAGLSWLTVLRKRVNYRAAFDGFDVAAIANYGAADVERLMRDAGIVRNRLKIESVIGNARGALGIMEEFGTLAAFFWSFVDHQPIRNAYKAMSELPPRTAISDALSKALKKRGFNFVGSTICYAFMQAVGMVDDHLVDCFLHHRCR